MWATLGDLRQTMGSRPFWITAVRLAVLVSLGLTVLLLAFTILLVLLPVALVGGLALHLYLRRKLRQANRRPHPNRVIDGEYSVLGCR
ncbi:hypothetical protein [Microvirga roseola]|uniref:hypothetical protein n=1 Tax=Microvirga roseola TaxID=2883126 RepID=UPI001E35A6B8|nr:hypothetical protein [Microvirga roseola]